MSDLTPDIVRLAAGAAAWAAQLAAARSTLAVETARTTAAVADDWVDAAMAIKQAAGTSADAVARAEETATGPLVTLRLLLVTARALADIDRIGLPRLHAEGPKVASLQRRQRAFQLHDRQCFALALAFAFGPAAATAAAAVV
jgi:hypothetical protein